MTSPRKVAFVATFSSACIHRRIAEAVGRDQLSITLVAEPSGFGSSSDFARALRSIEGMTPSAYREHAASG